MKVFLLSTMLSAVIGGLTGFAVMFYVNSQDASQMEDSFSEIDAQVSIAKAEWAKVYWFKRMALAAERYEARAPAITQRQGTGQDANERHGAALA